MYSKGDWQDRMRYSVTIDKLDRMIHHVTWKKDKGGMRVVPAEKVTSTYKVGVVAFDCYRMKLENDAKGKAKYGSTLWHRGAKIGSV